MHPTITIKSYNMETGHYDDAGTFDAREIGKSADAEAVAEIIAAYASKLGGPMHKGVMSGKHLTDQHYSTQAMAVGFLVGMLQGYAQAMPLEYTDPRNRSAAELAHAINQYVLTGQVPD